MIVAGNGTKQALYGAADQLHSAAVKLHRNHGLLRFKDCRMSACLRRKEAEADLRAIAGAMPTCECGCQICVCANWPRKVG